MHPKTSQNGSWETSRNTLSTKFGPSGPRGPKFMDLGSKLESFCEFLERFGGIFGGFREVFSINFIRGYSSSR